MSELSTVKPTLHGTPNPDTSEDFGHLSAQAADENFAVQATKENILGIINCVLKAGNISPRDISYPEIIVNDHKHTSYYAPSANVICIDPKHLNCIETYGEEIFHWLREQLKPPEPTGIFKLPKVTLFAVDEFFGYVGSVLLKQVCQGTPYELLNSGERLSNSKQYVDSLSLEKSLLKSKIMESNQASESERLITLGCLSKSLLELSHKSRVNGKIDPNRLDLQLMVVDLHLDTLRKNYQETHKNEAQKTNPDSAWIGIYEKYLFNLKKIVAELKHESQQNAANASQIEPPLSETKIGNYLEIGSKISKQIEEELLKNNELRRQQKIILKDLENHVSGYQAGHNFMQTVNEPVERILELMRIGSRDIYFSQIFAPAHSPDKKPSMASVLKEMYRLAIELNRQPDYLQELIDTW